MQGLGFSHECSTPHRSQSNGVAVRFVRRTKEGTACQVQQSGMCVAWWHLAARMYCFLYNVCEKVVKCEDGTWITLYEARWQDGPFLSQDICPFGTECEYKPADKEYKDRQHKLGEKLRHGIIVGYELHNGGKWTKNLLVIDWEAFAEINHPRRISFTAIHRSNVIIHTYASGMYRFLVAEGAILPKYIDNLKLSSEGSLFKEFRPWGRRKNKARREARAHLEPYNPNEHADAQLLEPGGPDEIPPVNDDPSPTPVEESPEDTWEMPNNLILIRHHNAPRRHLFIPTRDECPLPLEWLDVMRTTKTNINHEKYYKRGFLDYGSQRWSCSVIG